MSLIPRAAAAVAAAAVAASAFAQAFNYSPDEVRKRNAAAEYVFSRAALLGLLRSECTRFDRPSQQGVQATAFTWWERNQLDVEVAHNWMNAFLQHLRSTDPKAANRASVELAASTARTVRDSALEIFHREDPTAEACEGAIKPFAAPEADLQKLGPNSGSERFIALGEVLKEMRLDRAYAPGPKAFNASYEKVVAYPPIASLEAAVAAREKRDGARTLAIYERLAAQGDGRAAQAVSLMHMGGELVPRDETKAYGWSVNAFALGDYDALAEAGAMLLDGGPVPQDKRMAYAAFSIAARFAGDAASQERAQKSADALQAQLAPAERLGVKCMTLAQFDAALRQPLGGAKFGQVSPRPIVQPQRRLAELAPKLAEGTPASCPGA